VVLKNEANTTITHSPLNMNTFRIYYKFLQEDWPVVYVRWSSLPRSMYTAAGSVVRKVSSVSYVITLKSSTHSRLMLHIGWVVIQDLTFPIVVMC